jgi:hypothetical protein
LIPTWTSDGFSKEAVEDSKLKDAVQMHGGKNWGNYRAGSGRNSARVDGNDFEVLCIVQHLTHAAMTERSRQFGLKYLVDTHGCKD